MIKSCWGSACMCTRHRIDFMRSEVRVHGFGEDFLHGKPYGSHSGSVDMHSSCRVWFWSHAGGAKKSRLIVVVDRRPFSTHLHKLATDRSRWKDVLKGRYERMNMVIKTLMYITDSGSEMSREILQIFTDLQMAKLAPRM